MARAERLGKYELLRHLASGGMARVFLARVDGVGGFARHLVLKTVRPERTEDSSYVTMFLDEARLIATLHHQHVAQVYDVGVADDGTYYLAMEYLHGETVRAILERARDQRERLPLDFSLTVVAAAAAGLHHAHERRGPDGRRLGIVHRDVTPSNIIAGYDGSVKLIDFGIAKAAERSTQTKTGFIKGKAGYMAPEQALGQPVDRRADVFSLGVVLYELTTQTRAFPASSELEVAHRIVRGEVTPPSMAVAGYPSELEDVIMTALARDPDERFGDAEAFGYALDRAAASLGVSASPAAVSRVMSQLFGTRPEPWLVADADEPDEGGSHTGDTASLLDSRPLLVTTGNTSGPSTVGFARGTGAQDGPGRPRTSSDAPAARARTNGDAPPARPRTNGDAPAARARTNGDAPPARGRTNSEPPPGRVPTVPPSARAPTVSLRAQTPPPPAPLVDDDDDDDDGDEMPTVKFVALDEAEIIIEHHPVRGQRVIATTAVGLAPMPAGVRRTPLPGLPALPPIPGSTPSRPTIMPDASPLPIATSPASSPVPVPVAMPASVPVPVPVPATTSSRIALGSHPPPFAPPAPVLPAVAQVSPPLVPPLPRIGVRTEPVTALDQVTLRAARRRWVLPLIGGAVTAAVVIALGINLLTGDDGPATPAQTPAAALGTAAAVTTEKLEPPAAPTVPARAETTAITVRVTTVPADATVLLDGERLGRTPLTVERPRQSGSKVFLKVRRKGYSTKKVEVDLGADIEYDVALRKSDRDDE